VKGIKKSQTLNGSKANEKMENPFKGRPPFIGRKKHRPVTAGDYINQHPEMENFPEKESWEFVHVGEKNLGH